MAGRWHGGTVGANECRVTVVIDQQAHASIGAPFALRFDLDEFVLRVQAARRAHLADTGGGLVERAGLVPFHAVGRFLVTPDQRVHHTAMRARHMAAEYVLGQPHAGFDLAQAAQFWRAAHYQFRKAGALDALACEADRVAFVFDIEVEAAGLVQDAQIDADATVVFRGLAAQRVQRAAQQHFLLQRVRFVFGEVFREHGGHALDVAEHGLQFGFHELVAVFVGGLPHGDVAALVVRGVADQRQQHFGVADAGGFLYVDFLDVVVAHAGQDCNLETPWPPRLFDIAGFRRQVEILISPMHQADRIRHGERRQPRVQRRAHTGEHFSIATQGRRGHQSRSASVISSGTTTSATSSRRIDAMALRASAIVCATKSRSSAL